MSIGAINVVSNLANDDPAKKIAYNPAKARMSLNLFRAASESALSEVSKSYDTLMGVLFNFWATKKAVRFYADFNPTLVSIISNGRRDCNTIIGQAVASINEIARGGGSVTGFSYSGGVSPKMPTASQLLGESGGYKGITIGQVKNAVSEFRRCVTQAKNQLDAIRPAIEIYDMHQNIRSIYEDKIANFKKNLTEVMLAMSSRIDETINTYESTIESGRRQAAVSLENAISAIRALADNVPKGRG